MIGFGGIAAVTVTRVVGCAHLRVAGLCERFCITLRVVMRAE
jgi:hypothetical protein